ncbi:MAG TPA: DNA repair protein RecO [Bacillota bacterium]|nr:DNA repair protein RecO [Bacillota bacterium]
MLEKLQGVVIKTQDYKETHKIITIFSDKLGKFTALARGVKKPKSRMAATTQPFVYGEFLVYVSKGKGLGTIQQASIVHSMRQIREDIEKNAYASYVLELTDTLTENKQPLPDIYNELFHTLQWIAERDEYVIPAMMYELKLYEVGGFSPVLNRCVRCGSTQLPFSFSIREGGVLCNTCSHVDEQSIMLQGKLAHILHAFQQVSIEQIGNISLKQKNKELLRMLLDHYYDSYGSYPIKTKRFIKQLDALTGEN